MWTPLFSGAESRNPCHDTTTAQTSTARQRGIRCVDGVRMDCRDDACLHPYRKRKFFYALAELFNEPPPVIQRLEDFFPATDADAADADAHANAYDSVVDASFSHEHDQQSQPPVPLHDTTTSSSQQSQNRAIVAPSQEPEEDSFEYVDFDKSRTSLDSAASLRTGLPSQSSVHDSMQDSLLFLPPELHHQEASVSLSAATDSGRFSQRTAPMGQPTILSAKPSEQRPAELVDYYDLDRYCEAVPCWAYENQSSCTLHSDAAIRRPMLLFCLQALDEFIASTVIVRGDSALVGSCRLARIVFAAMWEQDVRSMTTDGDLVIFEYVTERSNLAGVSRDVWRILDACWSKHKQNFLHHQELYFVEALTSQPSGRVEQWLRIRDLLQVYGLRPQWARRLEAEAPSGKLSLDDLQASVSARQDASSAKAVQFGLAYLQRIHHQTPEATDALLRRDLLSQNDWKVAFSAIELHLKKLSRDVQVFPCGAFPRGAAFGSVVNVLVGLPAQRVGDRDSPIDAVVEVLSKANIVEQDRVVLLSKHRALAIVPYKNVSVVLDVKAFRRPQSWFALLYFTGPESFSQSYFSTLLGRPLTELSVVDFDTVYESAVEQLGLDVVASVDSEQHLFDLIHTEYIPPTRRM